MNQNDSSSGLFCETVQVMGSTSVSDGIYSVEVSCMVVIKKFLFYFRLLKVGKTQYSFQLYLKNTPS